MSHPHNQREIKMFRKIEITTTALFSLLAIALPPHIWPRYPPAAGRAAAENRLNTLEDIHRQSKKPHQVSG